MGKFVPRQRKHKHRVREEEERQKAAAKVGVASADDVNADVILPAGKAEKEEKRKRMREELRAQQPQSKISNKKQKRMDKYIVSLRRAGGLGRNCAYTELLLLALHAGLTRSH